MYCWGWVFDRTAKAGEAPRNYKTKDDMAGAAEKKWQQDMAGVVKIHYDLFVKYCPALHVLHSQFVKDNQLKAVMSVYRISQKH